MPALLRGGAAEFFRRAWNMRTQIAHTVDMAHCNKSYFLLIIVLIAAISAIAALQCAPFFVCSAEDTEEMASYTTSYASSGAGRAHNIRLAASALNDITIQPGQELSFNAAVGARTAERGYAQAKVISDGEYVEGIGGGVCQVSSTLFNAWVLAGLEVVRVQCHSLPSGYVPMSQDATVSEYIDLVLKNSAAFPVKVRTQADGTDLSIAIFGKKQPFRVTLLPEILSVVPAGEDIEYVDSLPEGEEYVIARDPKPGYRTRLVAAYTYPNGKVIKKQLRRDFYRPTDAKILMIAD